MPQSSPVLRRPPLALVIVDGFGINPNPLGNAVFQAKKPNFDALAAKVPYTELITFGERVGLPAGQMGNSEVGHLNIGSGRVIEQELLRINRALQRGYLKDLPVFKQLVKSVTCEKSHALHFIGLTSIGGVHSFLEHLHALIAEALERGIRTIYVHAITDGRDRPPQSAVEEVGMLENFLQQQRNKYPDIIDLRIGSIIGRYFAMDRDRRWERTKKAYELYTLGTGEKFSDPITALLKKRAQGAQDEFLEPMIATNTARTPTLSDGDTVVFFNFRADRMRQIVSSIYHDSRSFDAFPRKDIPHLSGIYSLTAYDETYQIPVLFPPIIIRNYLGEVLAASNIRQLRIAETEKYPHVTYFFNGGEEEPSPGEGRILVPSPRDVPTYDFKPEMSAAGVTDKLIEELRSGRAEVAICNYANCDMVGHTGKLDAAIKAVEMVDSCLGRLLPVLQSLGGGAIITADHGNAEQMIDYDTGEPHTAHTTFPVPLYLFGDAFTKRTLRSGGALCDIAPTMCELLGLATPEEMTGKSLLHP